MSDESLYSPPSIDEMQDRAAREGYHEYAHRMLGKRMSVMMRELFNLRDALTKEKALVEDLEAELSEALLLAYKYGTESTAERRARPNTLHGSVTIAAELAMQGNEAIMFACMDLAKKLVAPSRARASTGET